MPYISKKRANELEYIRHKNKAVTDALLLVSLEIKTSGEFNYVLSKLAANRIKDLGVNYENLKSVYGDMALAAEEFRERMIVPYETVKMSDSNNVDPYAGIEVAKK